MFNLMLNNILLGCVFMLTINTAWKRLSKSWLPESHVGQESRTTLTKCANVMSVLGSKNARVRQELLSYSMIVLATTSIVIHRARKFMLTHILAHTNRSVGSDCSKATCIVSMAASGPPLTVFGGCPVILATKSRTIPNMSCEFW